MPFFQGPPYRDREVSIGPPKVAQILGAAIANDVAGSVAHYLATAAHAATECYFCIYEAKTPVGQIVLHDINHATGESLVGYCLFRPDLRGRGIGTRALRLLQRHVAEQTHLTQLTIITDVDNLASQRIAQKCDFTYVGGAWEDPDGLVVYQWVVLKVNCFVSKES